LAGHAHRGGVSALVPRLAERPLVVAGRPAAVVARPTRAAGVGSQFDEPARDARSRETVEHLAGQVGGQLDERELGPDLDRPEVVARQAARVRERAGDLARRDPVPLAHGDPVRGHRSSAGTRAALGTLASAAPVVAIETVAVICAVAPVAAVAGVALVTIALAVAPRPFGLGFEQERRL